MSDAEHASLIVDEAINCFAGGFVVPPVYDNVAFALRKCDGRDSDWDMLPVELVRVILDKAMPINLCPKIVSVCKIWASVSYEVEAERPVWILLPVHITRRQGAPFERS
jgi:hypothetical protein